jgi:hypothetical protein
MLSDGRKLPAWVRFDPRTGKFIFKVPADFRGELKIKVTARDAKGNEASSLFRFTIGDRRGAQEGPLPLREQLRLAARPGMALARPVALADSARGIANR